MLVPRRWFVAPPDPLRFDSPRFDSPRFSSLWLAAWLVPLVLLPGGRLVSAAEERRDEAAPRENAAAAESTFAGQILELEGWTVFVREELRREQPAETAVALDLLERQLQLVARRIPAGPLAELRRVPLYLSPTPDGLQPKAEYHPSRAWLLAHDRDPAMAQAVEFTNVAIFPQEVERMPVVALHELAHAYHDRVLGFDNGKIKSAYEAAMQAGTYESVALRANGRQVRHYGATNPREYFAEATEAYFGTNDFFPENRTQLRQHDPVVFELLGELWEVPEAERQPDAVSTSSSGSQRATATAERAPAAATQRPE